MLRPTGSIATNPAVHSVEPPMPFHEFAIVVGEPGFGRVALRPCLFETIRRRGRVTGLRQVALTQHHLEFEAAEDLPVLQLARIQAGDLLHGVETLAEQRAQLLRVDHPAPSGRSRSTGHGAVTDGILPTRPFKMVAVMFDTIGKPFFAALATCADSQLGSGHACTEALRQAAASGTPEDIAAAEVALRALPETAREALMTAGHRTLLENPASLLGTPDATAPGRRLH